MGPLYELLKDGQDFVWSADCEKAFCLAKEELMSKRVLVHFDPKKEIVLSVDASPYGLGAVLSHRMKDGSERPIAYASRTLCPAEKNYAQIEKKGLAIIFGIKKFHLYLYGQPFTLITDHQPLTRIFGPKAGIPSLAAARMTRWALILTGYQYSIRYRSSSENANADSLSRLPLKQKAKIDVDENYIFHTYVDSLPVTAQKIAKIVQKDPVLSRVYEYTLSGWSKECKDESLQPYWNRRDELSIEDGCLLWGRRVIVPDRFRKEILEELHFSHPGMCRMKALARGYVWWPCLDADIEDYVKGYHACINTYQVPKTTPLLLWPWATRPWQRVHVDFLEIKGQQFFLLVDSYSKWLEVVPMDSTTAQATISVLNTIFSRYGFPDKIVSDNGPQFIAEDFKRFLSKNGIKQKLCPPYHPASNGLAEKHVQTFKRMYVRSTVSGNTIDKVSDLLFRYRNIPHSTTGKTPAELFLKRVPKTRLSFLKPSLQESVENRQEVAKTSKDGVNPKDRKFHLFQKVRILNLRGGKEKWIKASVIHIEGPRTYVVRTVNGKERSVHIDHIIPDDTVPTNPETVENPKDYDQGPGVPIPQVVPTALPNMDYSGDSDLSMPNMDTEHTPVETPIKTPVRVPNISQRSTPIKAPPVIAAPAVVTTRSGRVIRPAKKLSL